LCPGPPLFPGIPRDKKSHDLAIRKSTHEISQEFPGTKNKKYKDRKYKIQKTPTPKITKTQKP
jgi:hypothetical protein